MKTQTTRIGRFVLIAVALITATLLAVPAANAQDYPGGASFSTSDSNPVCGNTITLSGEGFAPNTEVTLSVGGSTIGTATTDATGKFSFPWTVPCTTIGSVTVTATDGQTTLTTDLNVRSATTTTTPPTTSGGGTSGGGTLPRTGTNSSMFLRIGVLLVSVGGLLVLGSRKRSNKIVKA